MARVGPGQTAEVILDFRTSCVGILYRDEQSRERDTPRRILFSIDVVAPDMDSAVTKAGFQG
jgi:hypothetical protein